MQDYRSLRVWQQSRDLALEIYQLTTTFPSEERFGLVSQMRRAAVSVTSNVAEGSSRSSQRDLARFLEIAVGSAIELEVQLELAVALGMLPERHTAIDRCNKLKRSLVRLIKSVTSHSER